MAKLGKNQTRRTQKIYQSTFNRSPISLTKKNLRNYQRDVNGTTR